MSVSNFTDMKDWFWAPGEPNAVRENVGTNVCSGSRGALTCGKAQMSVPISYNIDFLVAWALGPGPYAL
eukprot:12406413-Karenia_brevis.AAC.1